MDKGILGEEQNKFSKKRLRPVDIKSRNSRTALEHPAGCAKLIIGYQFESLKAL